MRKPRATTVWVAMVALGALCSVETGAQKAPGKGGVDKGTAPAATGAASGSGPSGAAATPSPSSAGPTSPTTPPSQTTPAPAATDTAPGLATPGTTSSPAAPGAPAQPASGAAAGANPQQVTGSSYTVKLHDLERRMNELKEQVFRSKARLNIMKETVLQGRIGGSRAIISHRNEMSSSYGLIRLAYALDGAEIFAKADDGGRLGDAQDIEIFNGSLSPGKHTVSVHMVYQGNGYGVFSYLKGYKANIEKTCVFNADDGKQIQLKVVGLEKGNPVTTDWDKRPAADCRISVNSDRPDKQDPADKGDKSKGADKSKGSPAPAKKK